MTNSKTLDVNVLNQLNMDSNCVELGNTDPAITLLQVNRSCVNDSNVSTFLQDKRCMQLTRTSGYCHINDFPF